jgi:ABC-type branched-subunit amino acid transport system substrate-binding protein
MALERAARGKGKLPRLKAMKVDDSGNADGAQRAAVRVAADERVAAVVGPVGDPDSDIMAEASKTYARNDVVVLSPWARLTGDLGATTYQVMGEGTVMEQATSDFLTELTDKAGTVDGVQYLSDGSDDYVDSVGRIFATTTDSGFPSSSEPIDDDIPQVVRDLMKSSHNVVYYAGDSETFEKLDAQLVKAGFRGLRLTQDAALDGTYKVKAPWLSTRDYCSWNDSFDTDYREQYGDTAELGGVESYDATEALIAALREPAPGTGGRLRDRVARNIGELSPKGLCNTDMRFGRDGYLLSPHTFMDVYERGESEGEELGDVDGKEALDRAKALMR